MKLYNLLIVTEVIRDRVPVKDRVIVSETINGRLAQRERSGLIYLSYDMDLKEIAMRFANLSLFFAKFINNESEDPDRSQSSLELCYSIIKELKLDANGKKA